MNSLLYVYNIQNLGLMKGTMSQYRIVSIAYLMNISNSVDDILEMDSSEVTLSRSSLKRPRKRMRIRVGRLD